MPHHTWIGQLVFMEYTYLSLIRQLFFFRPLRLAHLPRSPPPRFFQPQAFGSVSRNDH